MTRTSPGVIVRNMSTENPIRLLVLEEFRLRAVDVGGAAARIVAQSPHGAEPAIPLLTSVDDQRDVAMLRAVHVGETTETDAAQHAALEPLVSSWAVPKHYGPRVTEHSQSPPSSFRLAVTESGINAGGRPRPSVSEGPAEDQRTSHPVGLVWIGAPVGTHAGLLVLLGSYGDGARDADGDSQSWPLPLSRDLGVRIYENNGA